MMIGERTHHLNPTIQVPPWPVYDDPPTPTNYSPYPLSGVNSPRNAVGGGGEFSPYDASLTALRRFLPSNDAYNFSDDGGDADATIDAYSCDEFRMYEFKVRRCARGRSHDWTECPYAHPGEKARRRDPRKYHYSGTACPDFRKGNCKRGDSCEFAHGVFECWLHPARYRTQPCKDGVNCRRRVCFFAHTPEQLRVLPQQQQSPRSGGNNTSLSDSYDGSPLRQQQHHHLSGLDPYLMSNAAFPSSSPTSTLMSPPISPPSDSPPLSPTGAVTTMRRANGSSSVNEILVSLRQLQLNKATKSPIGSCGSWGIQQIVSPRGNLSYANGLNSTIPTTTTRMGVIGGGVGLFDGWDEPVERVESGRDLRFMMAEKLSKESSLNRTTASDDDVIGSNPDVDWVSDLLQ